MADSDERGRRVARVYSDVRDFAIFISKFDENTWIPFGPYRFYDGVVAIAGALTTLWATRHYFSTGRPLLVFTLGALITAGLVMWARQIPITRPSPMSRVGWYFNCFVGATRRSPGWSGEGLRGLADRWLGPPKAVVGNLRFTRQGVYAHFIVDGQPGAMDPFDRKEDISNAHQPLARNLPSGFTLSSWLTRIDPREMSRRMLGEHYDKPRWIQEVRDWEAYFNDEPFYERIFGLTVPIDNGDAGRTSTGAAKRFGRFVAGTDEQAGQSLEDLRQAVDRVIARLPRSLGVRKATPEQIQWAQRRTMTLGADDQPFPPARAGDDRLSAKAFALGGFDEGNRAGAPKRWWWPFRWRPAWRPILRIQYGKKISDSSYQAFVPVAQLPRAGLAFPKAEYLMAADDADLPDECTVDWYQYVETESVEKALAKVDVAERNLWDQFTHRAGRKSGDADLAERLVAAEDYTAALRASKLEKQCEFTTVLAVGSRSAEVTLAAAESLQDEFTGLDTSLMLHRGTQRELWQITNPGSEQRVSLSQFCHPTTVRDWARFNPLMSSKLGNESGILLALNAATRRPSPVWLDLEGAPSRRVAPVIFYKGPMGSGKSQSCKRVIDGLDKRGSQKSILDNGPKREWVPATDHHENRLVVDLTGKAKTGFDPLQCFPRSEAVESMLDHLAPMMGMTAEGRLTGQIRWLLRPDQRVAESMGGFVSWLNALTGKEREEYAELRDKLNFWSTVDYLQPIFNADLPQIDMPSLDTVVWLTNRLELPTTTATDNTHLYARQSPRARAGLAVYGLITVLTRLTYSRSTRFGIMVIEEAREYLQSPVGRAETLRTITNSRREHFGLMAISQRDSDFEGIGGELGVQQVIMPHSKNRKYAKKVFANNGIDPDEYPEVLNTRVEEDHGWAYYIDEEGRAGLVDLLPPAQQELVDAFDTNNMPDTDDIWDTQGDEDEEDAA